MSAQAPGDAMASDASEPLATAAAPVAPGSRAWAGASSAASWRAAEAPSAARRDAADAAAQTVEATAPDAATAPTAASNRVSDAVVVPTLVNSLQGQVARGPEHRAWQDAAPQRRQRRSRHPLAHADAEGDGEPEDERDAAPGDACRWPSDSLASPPAAAPEASAAYRRLSSALIEAAQSDAMRELARARRVAIVSPRASAAGGSSELALHLLWADARGVGRVQTYRARGGRADTDATRHAWRAWRLHRDADADGQPRLVAGKGLATASTAFGALAVRLAPGRLAPPLRDPSTSWIDLLEVRRLLHDLGGQWSVLMVWAPQPVLATRPS